MHNMCMCMLHMHMCMWRCSSHQLEGAVPPAVGRLVLLEDLHVPRHQLGVVLVDELVARRVRLGAHYRLAARDEHGLAVGRAHCGGKGGLRGGQRAARGPCKGAVLGPRAPTRPLPRRTWPGEAAEEWREGDVEPDRDGLRGEG